MFAQVAHVYAGNLRLARVLLLGRGWPASHLRPLLHQVLDADQLESL